MNQLKFLLVLVFIGLGRNGFTQTAAEFEESVTFSIPKTIYFTGEKIWLAIQVVTDAKPSPSRIVYAELWSRYSESVALTKIPLQTGEAFNFLQIPVDLPSDQYLLRVYTRVSPIQNMEDGLVQAFVTVFNPRVPPEVVTRRANAPTAKAASVLLSLSQNSVRPGEQLTITYTGSDSVQEVTVAVPNPFLHIEGKLSSSEIYESLESGKAVPEFFGHIIEARDSGKDADSTNSGLYYLSLHGEKSILLTDKVDSAGSLYFDAGGIRQWNYMIAQRKENQTMSHFEIISPSPKTKFKIGFQFPKLQISPTDAPLLRELLRGSQIEEYFVQEFNNEPIPVVTGFVQDRTFLLDDYNRFDDLETHVKEYVPEVLVRSRDKSKEMRVLNVVQGRSFAENPLMLVDAMPVFDADLLLKFNPAKIEKMEILTRPFYINEEIYPGVISFSSFKNDFGGFPLPANAVYIPYSGILPPVNDRKNLFQPSLQNPESMDWRTILHWSTAKDDEVPTQSVSVVAPLLTGTFQVVMTIRDSEGNEKREYTQFQVK